jgi:hypothetical protein
MSARNILRSAPPALLLTLILLMAWRCPALAHGVELETSRGEAVVVIGNYSDGEPMSFVKVRIKNPEGKTHQVGNADAKGRFAFLVDQPGKWLATLEDGMGHKGEIAWRQAAASGEQIAPDSKPQSADLPKWVRAVWGLSAIFWLSGLLFWFKSRKRSR